MKMLSKILKGIVKSRERNRTFPNKSGFLGRFLIGKLMQRVEADYTEQPRQDPGFY